MTTFQMVLDSPSNGEVETELTEIKPNKTVEDATSANKQASSSSTTIEIDQAPTQQAEEFVEEKQKVEVRAAMRASIDEPAKEDPYYNEDFGCGMSGGGIRSAAFCSGVMWELMNQAPRNTEKKNSYIELPRGKIPKFYSCVSGGGYIGASFLWWARCNGGGDPRAWQNEYFGRMKRGIGYFIDFTNPFYAIRDTIQLICVTGLLLAFGIASFLPGTYILIELISYPWKCNCGPLQVGLNNFLKDLKITAGGFKGGDDELDLSWILFIVFCASLPGLTLIHFVVREYSLAQLQSVFLTDVSSKKLRVVKILREMIANLYWYAMSTFQTYAFVVLWDFSDLGDSNDQVDVYNTTLANSLRIVILAFLFYKSPDLISNFLQAQVIIWAYRDTHSFFGVSDGDFVNHYEKFALACKILLPFIAVAALFRERTLLEFVRYRLSKAFFDAPTKVAQASLSFKGVVCGPKFGQNNVRNLFWTPPDKNSHYPVYISGITVNKWMVVPESSDLFPKDSLRRELEARFYFDQMPDQMKPAIEGILKEGEDRVKADQQANSMVVKSTATESDPDAPPFFRQRSARDRAEILKSLNKLIQAHSSSESNKVIEEEMAASFQFTASEVSALLSWLSEPSPEPIRRLTIPQTDIAKRFIGDNNIKSIDFAINEARKSMKDLTLQKQFEDKKEEMVNTLRNSLRALVWRNLTPKSAGTDVLALSSEGWWERYEVGLNEPIFILPPSMSKTEANVHNKLDALVGANPDFSLSEALGISAAIGSLASTTKKHKPSMRTSQVLAGLHTGRWVNTISIRWPVQMAVMLCFELLLCLPAIIKGGITDPSLRKEKNEYSYWGGILTVLLYGFWVFLLPLMKGSRFYPFLPHSRLASALSEEDVWSHSIPSMLYLSNGGDSEKLGLLPLLARRLKWIVMASGDDSDCDALLSALDQARVKLGVSFRELYSDQKRRLMRRVANKELDLKSDIEFFARDASQRVIVFEVIYPRAIRSWKKSAGSFAPSTIELPPQQKGYIFFMQPVNAHPTGFVEGGKPESAPLGAECIEHLDKEHASLAGCCCRCCHRFSFLTKIGGAFPYHRKIFQFFTPTLFDAYHAQGVQAMRDAFAIVLDNQIGTVQKKA